MFPQEKPIQPEKKLVPKKRRYHSCGYNSDDEYHRPRVSPVNESEIQFLTTEEFQQALQEKGFVIVPMPEDGNCLFHSVADQVYGDNSFHDVVRKLCLDYMEKERDHFSGFVSEDFSSYIKRKRMDGVFGNHLELQAISEIYSRAIEIYTNKDPLNIFQGSYSVDNPPIRLSYHHGNHYNSIRDPKNPKIGIGLGFPGTMTVADVKASLLESEQAMITRLLLERAKKESDEMEIDNQIFQQAKKEIELTEVENEYLAHIKSQSENELLNQVLEKSKMETETQFNSQLEKAKEESQYELSQGQDLERIMEQTRREQMAREEEEFQTALRQSTAEYCAIDESQKDQMAELLKFVLLQTFQNPQTKK